MSVFQRTTPVPLVLETCLVYLDGLDSPAMLAWRGRGYPAYIDLIWDALLLVGQAAVPAIPTSSVQTHYNETKTTTPKPGPFSTESLYGNEDSGCNCGALCSLPRSLLLIVYLSFSDYTRMKTPRLRWYLNPC